jgi:undecaprenyl-diphosphatase
MTIIKAALLGLIQGLTEFFPVSSSGHLVILQKILGFTDPPIAFDVLVHTATLLAVIIFFWEDILKINIPFLKAIAIGTLPTLVIGLVLNNKSDLLFSNLTLVGLALLITTLVLYSTKWLSSPQKKQTLNLKTAFMIGIAQGLAVIPGISRSGATIITGLWLGLTRKEAVRFAFILSIPAILGAQLLKLPEMIAYNQINPAAASVGFIVAAISGWFALRLLKSIVNKAKLHRFALYTLILALLILLS